MDSYIRGTTSLLVTDSCNVIEADNLSNNNITQQQQ
jgi:hypothetical protein